MKGIKFLKKMATLSMLCAIAYVAVFLSRMLPPLVLFLQYDPKDIVITLGGFIFGPLSSLLISVVVSLVELVTVSDTGIIGLIMNVISTCTFACTAAIIYKKKRTLSGAVIGLVAGCLFTTAAMLLWNYAITPMYMHIPREEVKALLLPAFMPFNLIKGGLNAAFTLLLYKPLVSALRAAKLIDPAKNTDNKKVLPNIAIVVVSLLIIASLIAVVFILKK
ncbi:MAG: ECF transporter S component [Clostridia bacterium]|nr:ECF transporter S component [Clostridia bacterium]